MIQYQKKSLTFFIALNKLTEEFILQEGTLISLKIPKNWQKPDRSVKRPALWVCHLPENSLGIVYISLYPTELVIKKSNSEVSSKNLAEHEEELEEYEAKQKKEDLITYKGTLEPNGETEKETFFRCRLKLQKKKEKEEPKSSETSGLVVFLIILFIAIIIGAIAAGGGFK